MVDKGKPAFRADEMATTQDEATRFEQQYGTEDSCLNNEGKAHEADYKSVTTSEDGGIVYVDVSCRHCGRSGCIDSIELLEKGISW